LNRKKKEKDFRKGRETYPVSFPKGKKRNVRRRGEQAPPHRIHLIFTGRGASRSERKDAPTPRSVEREIPAYGYLGFLGKYGR